MITLKQSEKVKNIARNKALEIIEELDKFPQTIKEIISGAMVCSSYIAASIINSYCKRENISLNDAVKLFMECLNEAINDGRK